MKSLSDDDGHLIEAVGDGSQDEDTSEGGKDPHPPRDPRLPRFTRDDSCGHHVGLENNKLGAHHSKL